jgi:hypothetical protein
MTLPARLTAALAASLLLTGLSACAGRGGGTETVIISFELDTTAFTAPPAPRFVVPFDVVSADMDLDGDPDVLVNWHNVARLELFENDGGAFRLINPEGDDRSGIFENPGIADLYGAAARMLAEARAAGAAGVFVWHDPDRRGDWNFYVVPDGEPVALELRANGPLTMKLDPRFVRESGEFEASLELDGEIHFAANVAFVAAQLALRASLPLFVGAGLQPAGHEVELWKDDPHGIAWIDARGSGHPDLFITRGALMGTLAPPHDPKVDRFFVYTGGDPLYEDERAAIPRSYGRGRRVEWVDIDGDGLNELYIGNTATPNELLATATPGEPGAQPGRYRDIAGELGLDVHHGDTFAWLDVDGDGRDDLVFVGESGFEIAYNRGGRRFEIGPGADAGLLFPAGSQPRQIEELFVPLSLNVIDFDSDGRLDLWLSGHGAERRHALYRAGDAGFTEVTAEVGLDAAPGANAIAFFDADNDGYQDAVVMGIAAAFLHNEGGRRFVTEPLDPAWELQAYTRSVAVDVDDDGRLDVVLMGHRRMLLRNTTTGGGGALRVLLRGVGADPAGTVAGGGDPAGAAAGGGDPAGAVVAAGDPVGTVVAAIYDNGMVQAQRYGSALNTRYSQGSAPLHFGIPPGASITHLRVRWPDGSVTERPVAAGETRIELRR